MVCDMLLVALVAGFAVGWVRGTWTVSRRALSGWYNSRVLRKRRRPEPARSLASAGSLMSMRNASSVMMRINSLYVPHPSVRARGAGMGAGASAAAAAAVARVSLVSDSTAAGAADSPSPSSFSSSRARRVLRRQGSSALTGRQASGTVQGSRGASGSIKREASSTTTTGGLGRQISTSASISIRRTGSTAAAFAKTWSRLRANSAAVLAISGGGGGGGGGRPLGEGTEAGPPDHKIIRSEVEDDSSQLEEEEIASPTLPCVPHHLGSHLGDGAWTAAPVAHYVPPEDCCESDDDDDDDGAATIQVRRKSLGRTSTLHPRLSPYGQGAGGGAEEQEDPSRRLAAKGKFASILKSR